MWSYKGFLFSFDMQDMYCIGFEKQQYHYYYPIIIIQVPFQEPLTLKAHFSKLMRSTYIYLFIKCFKKILVSLLILLYQRQSIPAKSRAKSKDSI